MTPQQISNPISITKNQPIPSNEPALNFISDLPAANPIIKREKMTPFSIFAQLELPKFTYPSLYEPPEPLCNILESGVSNQVQSSLIGKKSLSPNKKEKLDQNFLQVKGSNKFKEIFSNPVYQCSQKLRTTNNYDYACLYMNYSQSKAHKIIKDPIFQSSPTGDKQMIEKMSRKQFQSNFESGNLAFVARDQFEGDRQVYNMVLMRDINTSRCTQWFFFRVIAPQAGKAIFRILNFTKNYSIFQNGMKVCYASNRNNFSWMRGCQEISYLETNISMEINKNPNRNYYGLSFSYTFRKNQIVYFAYCYPYTYSMLQSFIYPLAHSQKYRHRLKLRNIGMSLGGNNIEMLTITNFEKKEENKKLVYITARVHPAQTPSSFVCEGMIRYLLSESQEAESLLEKFVFKIVPMLNPDGVINGSYRCSLSGFDMNRVWNRADKNSHPEIFAVKKQILDPNSADKMFLFVDLHAHSKKKGVFMYGCQNKNNPYLSRQIPFLLWKNVPEFNYYQCNFSMKHGREGTARLFISKQLDFPQSYTMEHSFCGPSKEKVHFSMFNYLKIGQNFMVTLQRFYARGRNQLQGDIFMQSILKELYTEKQYLKIGEKEEGSSSDDELDKQKNKPLLEKPQIKEEGEKKNKRFSESAIKESKLSLKKLRKITNYERKFTSDQNTQFKFEPLKLLPKNNFMSKQITVISTGLGQQENPKSARARSCVSSLTGPHKKHEQSMQMIKKSSFKDTWRYQEQEEQINNLNNLFLPSLKSASYKKYSRKTIAKNMVHIGRNMIDETIMKKEEIRAVERKRVIGWKERAMNFL